MIVSDNPVKKLSGAMANLAGISGDVQASFNEIHDAFDHKNEQVEEFKPLGQELSEELNFNKDAHKVASETNLTFFKAIQVLLTDLSFKDKG